MFTARLACVRRSCTVHSVSQIAEMGRHRSASVNSNARQRHKIKRRTTSRNASWMRFLSKLIGTGFSSATSTAASVVQATAYATLRPFQRLFDFSARQPQITYPPSVLESVIQALPSTRRNTLDGDLPQRRVTRASIARASGASSTISRPSVVGDREASGLEAPLRLPRPSVGTAAKSIGRSEDFLEKPKKPDLGVRRISRTFIVARERRTSALTRRISLVAKPKSARLSDSFSVNGQTAAHLTDLTSNRENDDDLFKQLAKYSLDRKSSAQNRINADVLL